MPRFIALASGESLWPKQTGQASAGAGDGEQHRRQHGVTHRLHPPGFPLERRAVDDQAAAVASAERAGGDV